MKLKIGPTREVYCIVCIILLYVCTYSHVCPVLIFTFCCGIVPFMNKNAPYDKKPKQQIVNITDLSVCLWDAFKLLDRNSGRTTVIAFWW